MTINVAPTVSNVTTVPDNTGTVTSEIARGLALSIGGTACVDWQSQILEVAAVPAITAVPNTQPWFCGLAALNGELIAVTDLAQWCGYKPSVLSPFARLLVLQSDSTSFAVIVDEVEGPADIATLSHDGSSTLSNELARLDALKTGSVNLEGIVKIVIRLDRLHQQQSFLNPGREV